MLKKVAGVFLAAGLALGVTAVPAMADRGDRAENCTARGGHVVVENNRPVGCVLNGRFHPFGR
ncbi:hypothetical protein BH18ACT4_BH18ACT4_09800 [soil metagenome]